MPAATHQFATSSDGDETAAVQALTRSTIPASQRIRALEIGRALVHGVRRRASERPYLDAFLQEFGLSSEEGVALMCLAEALLRIPDDEHADRLIAEKLASGDWSSHAGSSESLFVNASTWGLMLTGKLVQLPEPLRNGHTGWIRSLVHRAGEPVVRRALRAAMHLMGDEFVVGRTIEEALRRTRREQSLSLCSFDMLGEGARTDAEAQRYFESYAAAIRAIAASNRLAGIHIDPHTVSSISIKLSALDPRYVSTQRGRIRARLLPRARELAHLAASENIALTLDAEEADRLEISLEVFESLARDLSLGDWQGLGLAVQAYGRRAPVTLSWIQDLVKRIKRPVAVRLVKGAYWDSEIKRAQERGLADYPVYTRKISTDIAYLACARRLFEAGQLIYPQFATHNAHTIGAVLAMRPPGARFEFQRLHGMGQLIYAEAQRTLDGFPPVRVYAPVGAHAELLAYLVRRLLENGANTSFINRFMDESIPPEEIVTDPLDELARLQSIPHPELPLPGDLFRSGRRNSHGVDLGELRTIESLERAIHPTRPRMSRTAHKPSADATVLRITNPADRRECIGEVPAASIVQVARAFDLAALAQSDWMRVPVDERAACLERATLALESQRDQFLSLLVREAGKTLPDAVAEIREAIDFCRYYAQEARRLLAGPQLLQGPTGESNQLSFEGRGAFACISPWNFPLAIFTGQITAALVTGNTVVAKPAEQTPLVALAMTELLHKAGIPRLALHCLPMKGRPFGEVALRHAALAGVAFTGSTGTAQWINQTLAVREGAILPLIAETGGINAMIVDSTALAEQVIDDVITSAFGSAGQRCSALRLLCLQEDVAEPLIERLTGAMQTLVIGNPAEISTDIGPVICDEAAFSLMSHVERMTHQARLIAACPLQAEHARGSFVAPHLIEIAGAAELKSEHFGPILHVTRYRSDELDELLGAIRSIGYGLTLGVQTRLESTWRRVLSASRVGNVYVNRNMIGAVVGVQPFGGTGLSGTGPKAGGPHYLERFATERTLTINTAAIGGNANLLRLQ